MLGRPLRFELRTALLLRLQSLSLNSHSTLPLSLFVPPSLHFIASLSHSFSLSLVRSSCSSFSLFSFSLLSLFISVTHPLSLSHSFLSVISLYLSLLSRSFSPTGCPSLSLVVSDTRCISRTRCISSSQPSFTQHLWSQFLTRCAVQSASSTAGKGCRSLHAVHNAAYAHNAADDRRQLGADICITQRGCRVPRSLPALHDADCSQQSKCRCS